MTPLGRGDRLCRQVGVGQVLVDVGLHPNVQVIDRIACFGLRRREQQRAHDVGTRGSQLREDPRVVFGDTPEVDEVIADEHGERVGVVQVSDPEPDGLGRKNEPRLREVKRDNRPRFAGSEVE